MTQQDAPFAAALIDYTWSYWVSQILRQTAEMGLADKFGDDPMHQDALCADYGMHVPSFRRYLRSLSGLGIVTQVSPGYYQLTPQGEAMKTGAPGSARASIIALMGKLLSTSWDNMDYSLHTGKTGFGKHFGRELFDYLRDEPGMAALFSETMVGLNSAEPPAVAAAYDFSQLGSLIDIGGASGNLIGHILQAHPGLKGGLFDQPHVVLDAPALLDSLGVTDRVEVTGGSFFEAVPTGYDAYMLSHVIHDWTEAECADIFATVKAAMKPDSRLLIVEMVLPEDDSPHPGKLLDMMMLVATGGQERTPSEYRALLAANGFTMTRIVPTASAVSVVEAVLA